MHPRTPMLIAGGFAVLLVAGGITWALWPEPPPPDEPDEVEDKDTGMTREETEELMRTIGYVQ